ncbi:hypothetical protein [Salegentibacter mishustinae]|uniref:hypothetical protein n=1 Tax=Salegentibacter mishustinae TaxID=270918 RepID=UPI0024921EEF|nr:hypothetical protein [Salegentibacter mishustinae]
MKNKNIQIREKHHKELQKLSESFGQSYGGLAEKMIPPAEKFKMYPDAIVLSPQFTLTAMQRI